MTVWEIVVVAIAIAFIALWIWLARWSIKQVASAFKSKKFSAKLVGAVVLLAILVRLGVSFIAGFFG